MIAKKQREGRKEKQWKFLFAFSAAFLCVLGGQRLFSVQLLDLAFAQRKTRGGCFCAHWAALSANICE